MFDSPFSIVIHNQPTPHLSGFWYFSTRLCKKVVPPLGRFLYFATPFESHLIPRDHSRRSLPSLPIRLCVPPRQAPSGSCSPPVPGKAISLSCSVEMHEKVIRGITSTAWIDYPCDGVSIRPSNLSFGNEIELKG